MNKKKREEVSIKAIRDAINKYGKFRFMVRGVSMFPFLIEGDEVIIEKVFSEDLQKGDIAMYIRDNLMIVHRIIKVYTTKQGRRLFIFRGDNLRYDDQPVWEEDVMGKATKVIRGDLEFTPPSFHPLIITATRFILDKARNLRSLLGLSITQKEIISLLRRSK